LLCGRCNHNNPEHNRYCGMCGVRLETPSAKPAETVAVAKAAPPARNSASAAAAGTVRAASSSTSILGLDAKPEATRPPITGPSFLGLGTEPAADRTDYLLEDDEPHSHAGRWITLIVLVAAGVAIWHFRAELRPIAIRVYDNARARVNPQPAAPAAPAAPPEQAAATEPAAAPQPVSAAANAPAPPANSASTEVAPSSAAVAGTPAKPAEGELSAVKEKSVAPARTNPAGSEEPAPAKNAPRTAKFTHTSRQRTAEATEPEDNAVLKLAQKYIRGEGVRQDCVTGMAYLREAMKHPNAQAASQMGALYATGTCVALDRVAAYKYFSAALQMEPSNPWLGAERDKLYGQMSSTERRQADRQ